MTELVEQPGDWFKRLGTVTQELIDAHNELATVLYSEKQAYVAGLQAPATSASERQQAASVNAGPSSVEAVRLQQEIHALYAERDYLMFVLSIRNPNAARPDVHRSH